MGTQATSAESAREAVARVEAAARAAGGEPCALLKFGELALKGRNRDRFSAQLERNLGGLAAGVEAALRVPGLSVIQPAVRAEPTLEAAGRLGPALLRGRPGASFAVRARRREQTAPFRSREIAVAVGAAVQSEL